MQKIFSQSKGNGVLNIGTTSWKYDEIVTLAENINYGISFDESDWQTYANNMGISVEKLKSLMAAIKNMRGSTGLYNE